MPQRTPAARGGGTQIQTRDGQRQPPIRTPTFTLQAAASPSPTGLDLMLGETLLEAGPLASSSSSLFPQPRDGPEVTRCRCRFRPEKWRESFTYARNHRSSRRSFPRSLSTSSRRALSSSGLLHTVQTGDPLTLNQFTRSSTTSPPLLRKGVAKPILID